MASTLLTTGRNLKGVLLILPFLMLPLMTIAPSMTAPAIGKQGVGAGSVRHAAA